MAARGFQHQYDVASARLTTHEDAKVDPPQALAALAHQGATSLAAISPDPVGAWRRRDPDVVRALALLELRDAGLRPPRPTGTDSVS